MAIDRCNRSSRQLIAEYEARLAVQRHEVRDGGALLRGAEDGIDAAHRFFDRRRGRAQHPRNVTAAGIACPTAISDVSA